MKKIHIIFLLLAVLVMVHYGPSPTAAGKKELEAIQGLRSEFLILQRQVRDMQESIDKNNGQLLALVNQVGDQVARASHALTETQTRMRDMQIRVSSDMSSFDNRLSAIEANFQPINRRLTETMDQLDAIRQELAKATSVGVIDPTDPIQVFSVAYGDYLKGNYQLSIDQFRNFLVKFPSSEQADDAQFWIGESYFSQGLYDQAIEEFDVLITQYESGDKVPAAHLKKGLALLAEDHIDEGIRELRRVLKAFPDSSAAAAAKQRLEELGVPLSEPRKSTRRRPSRGQ